mmetsp:Transcript_36543/g.67590  ORF Transcript_36543/g.67590 Transcript_36543/m.67590 type:complete len:468 (-) Transcript_36543:149-1552(-)
MGSSCSRDASAAVETGASSPPIASTSRSTEASMGMTSRGQRSMSVDPSESFDGSTSTSRSFLSRLRRSTPSGLSRQQERELREIEQLQFELAAMEALFQSMLGQAFREMASGGTDPEGGGGNGAPPASKQAIQQLPSVRVSPEDLIEESNRECIICYVENRVNDSVVRLPCGHLFHRECVSQWLLKRCTCPVCRYEIPTDDPIYERGRVERMRMRRPRMRRYELERMPARELRELAFTRLNLSDHFDVLTDRKDLIDRIVDSGKVDIIASPDPSEYKISQLRSMKISELRSTMTDAGVIFDPLEVVEKEDMVNMFLESGRVCLLPEEGESTKDKLPKIDSDCVDECSCSGGSCQKLSICSDSPDRACASAERDIVGMDCIDNPYSGSEKLQSGVKMSQAGDNMEGEALADKELCLNGDDSVPDDCNSLVENDCSALSKTNLADMSGDTACAKTDIHSMDIVSCSSET